jgi:uncharacterized membrane protein
MNIRDIFTKILLSLILFTSFFLGNITSVHAVTQGSEVTAGTQITGLATPSSETELREPALTAVVAPQYTVGTVTEIVEEKRIESGGRDTYTQALRIRLNDKNEVVQVQAGNEFQPLNANQRVNVGTQVVLAYQEVMPGQFEYVISDIYRMPVLVWLGVGFFALVLFIARKQGLFSIMGMVLSLFVLTYMIVPQILAGQNPILISLLGCCVIATLTVYLSHGFTRESHIALAAMFMTLASVSILSYITVHLSHLVGLGTEEAYYLQFGPSAKLNLQGLLLGGIMLGTLGVLDDITIAQISIVTQLKEAKPDIEFFELYNRGLSVGKDHVASLVNTLILAYAGSSLPLFLLFTMSQTQPTWVAVNSEMIAEEVVRTLTGSIGLVIAVPLATLAASYFAIYRPQQKKSATQPHIHAHSHRH